MLRELEKLLQQFAEQQGIVNPKQQQRPRQQMRPPQQPPQRRALEITDADVIDAEPVHEDIREHVASHIDTSDIAEHVSHLGERVGLADEKMESHLHEAFDHKLSSFDNAQADTGEKSPQKPSLAQEVAAMLRQPKTIRQAVVLNEVFNRPKWSDD